MVISDAAPSVIAAFDDLALAGTLRFEHRADRRATECEIERAAAKIGGQIERRHRLRALAADGGERRNANRQVMARGFQSERVMPAVTNQTGLAQTTLQQAVPWSQQNP